MTARSRSLSFWSAWLRVVSAGVAVFGLALVLAPGLARRGFALLVYGDASRIEQFGAEAVAYISLSHAVLGSVMFGWAVALFLVVGTPFREGRPYAWFIIAASVVVWFVPDTVFSVGSGFWQNAVLNAVFIVLFAVPLIATYRAFHGTGS